MRLLTLILFLYLSIKYSQEKCLTEISKLDMLEFKLKRHLIWCGNDNLIPPNRNKSEPVDVRLSFRLKRFDYKSSEQKFTIYTWTAISWDDKRIKWDPNKYDGVERIVRHGGHIWTPNIKLLNSIEDSDISYMHSPCEISSDGHVECILRLLFNAKCFTDLREWPRDAQTCSLEFGVYDQEYYNGIKNKIRLNFNHRAISMFGSEYGSEWDIMDYKQEVNQSDERQLKMSFTLERHAEILVALVIYPSVILSALSLSTLVLDVRRDLRLFLACFSLLCHFYFLSDLAMEIPEHGNNAPNILLYFRGSVIMTIINVALTISMKTLCGKDTTVPAWMATTNKYVFRSYGKFVVFPRWQIETLGDKKSKNVKDWADFANFINSVWMYISVVVYIVLYCVLVPPERPWN